MNIEFNGPIDWFEEKRNFTARPSVIGPDGSVSGVALYDENYYTESFGTINVSAGRFIATLLKDGFDMSIFPPSVTRRVKLHPKFHITSQHTTASAPSEWVVRLRRNAEHVASGWFKWDPAANGIEETHGTWLTDADPTLFTPILPGQSADVWSLQIDNDGSGTLVDTPIIRGRIGFTPFDPVFSGLI